MKAPDKRLRWLSDVDEVILACGIAVLAIVLVACVWLIFPSFREGFLNGVFIEFSGAIFDVIIFGVILAFLGKRLEEKRQIREQREIIDDYKFGESEETKLRIAGAMRRLATHRITKHDFQGLRLKNFSFKKRDIDSINGSWFHDASAWSDNSRSETTLTNVSFDGVDCAKVVFSPRRPSVLGFSVDPLMRIKNCSFVSANLTGAQFSGALLHWDDEPPADQYEHDDDPQCPAMQVHFGPFYGADIKETSFIGSEFQNCDFRGAENIETACFANAKGLDQCLFDDDDVKARVVSKAQSDSRRLKEERDARQKDFEW